MNTIAYTNATIFTGERWLDEQVVLVRNETIVDIVSTEKVEKDFDIIDCQGKVLAPAFIDLQIYGAGSQLFSAFPTVEALQKLVDHNLKFGTSQCLATIATQSLTVIYACLDAIKKYGANDGKGILGLHLEGPFINKIKRGAHIENLIHTPTEQEVSELLEYANGVIKMVTLAPEICSKNVIDLFVQAGVIVSAGHSNATYLEAMNGFKYGIKTVTHLFNAMSPLHHRDVGMPGAVLNHPTLMASIIPDGIHVSFEAVMLAKKLMGERLFFITDAVTETNIGAYQHVFNKDHYTLPNGTLSGSALTLLQAVKNAVNHCCIPIDEALRMASLYPAKLMGIDNNFGKIEIGYAADFAIMDKATLPQTN